MRLSELKGRHDRPGDDTAEKSTKMLHVQGGKEKKRDRTLRLSKSRSTNLLIFYINTFHQQVDEDETGKLESSSAPHSERLEPEETFSTEEQTTETEQDTQKSGSPPLQDQEKVADFCLILCKMLTHQVKRNQSRGGSQPDADRR